MRLSNPSIFERIPKSLLGATAMRRDDSPRHDAFAQEALRHSVHRATRVPLSRSATLLHARLALWLLTAFVGASMVASVLARIVQSGDSLRLEIAVLVSVSGMALTWFALRRMRVLIDRADQLDW